MSRPFIEFIHTQDIAWKPSALGPQTDEKILSRDPAGPTTRLLRLAPGATTTLTMGLAAEVFVLTGTLSVSGQDLGYHGYAYLPVATSISSRTGATVLAFFDPPAGDNDPAIVVDTIGQPWDRTGLEGEIAHLNYARKNLRFSPLGDRRTYLLGGMPHGFPSEGAKLEKHPHAEEMFLIAGDMPCSLGVMTSGAYFYRPPDVWHGLDCTLSGFLMIMRTPGSNVTISRWSDDLLAVSYDPDHAPELPAGHPPSPPRALVPAY